MVLGWFSSTYPGRYYFQGLFKRPPTFARHFQETYYICKDFSSDLLHFQGLYQETFCICKDFSKRPPTFARHFQETSYICKAFSRDLLHLQGLFKSPTVTSLTVSHTGFTEHIKIKGECGDCRFPVFWGLCMGGYTGPTMGSEITTKSPSAA